MAAAAKTARLIQHVPRAHEKEGSLMNVTKKGIISASLFAALTVTNGVVLAAPYYSQAMVNGVLANAIANTDATEKSGVQMIRARKAMDWARIWEQLMADQARRRRGSPSSPGAPGGKPAPAGGLPRQQFSIHLDNCGFTPSGIWRTGLFYTNRDLTGHKDRLTAVYMRAKGVDAVNTLYTTPLGKSGAELDISYLANRGRVIGGPTRAFGVHSYAWSAGMELRYPLMTDRDRRVRVGIGFEHVRQSSDMNRLPQLGWRGTVLRGRYNRLVPHLSFAHHTDSSLLYHRHEIVLGKSSTLAHGHQSYAKYCLTALYQKRYQHGQMLKARFDGQLFTSRQRLGSLERFYLGGEASVRGYKESLINGDRGFAASLQYQVPLEKTRRLSAFTFLDYGRVYGASAPVRGNDMMGTGLGLAWNTRDVHAALTLGLPLKREVAGERVGGTRIHLLLHASF